MNQQIDSKPSRYKLLNGSDLAQLPPLVWRVKGVLPATGIAGIYGPSGSGKSFLCLDLAIAIANGKPWFGRRVNAAPVVYAGLEGEAGFKQRVDAWRNHFGQSLPENLHFMLQPFKLPLEDGWYRAGRTQPDGHERGEDRWSPEARAFSVVHFCEPLAPTLPFPSGQLGVTVNDEVLSRPSQDHPMKKISLFLACFVVAANAIAACQCACVNGQMQSLCSSSLDIPAMCVGLCPLAPPSLQPLPSLQIPPIGTQQCSQKQVLNPSTGRYEWRSVCQ